MKPKSHGHTSASATARYEVLRPRGRRSGFRLYDREQDAELAIVHEERTAYRLARTLNGQPETLREADFTWDGRALWHKSERLIEVNEATQEIDVDLAALDRLQKGQSE